MNIEWGDIVKLAAPFITGILMVWIKGWIEIRLSRNNKQHALSRLLNDALHELLATVQALKRIAESAANGKLRLVSMDVSNLISKFAGDLADLDSRQAYCYADLASSLEVVNKGLSRLSTLTLSRAAASTKEIACQLDRAIVGQSKITATDFISMSKAALCVMKAIPLKYRYPSDPQAMENLEQAVTAAENDKMKWPNMLAQQSVQADSLASGGPTA